MATATASVISRILGTSLIPNHTISSGTSAKFGTARSTSMFASTKFSPTRDSPAINASPSPSVIPNSTPYPTRSRLVNRCSCNDPSAIRRTAVRTTRVGGGTVRSSNTLVLERSCHITTSNIGPNSRCSQRGTNCLRCRPSISARGSTSAAGAWACDFEVSARERESTIAMSGAPEEVASQRLGFATVGSDRDVAHQRDAVQYPLSVDVFEVAWREVKCRAVVPERDASRLPLEAHRVLGSCDLLEQQVEHVPALAGRQVDDLPGEGRVDVDHSFLGLR